MQTHGVEQDKTFRTLLLSMVITALLMYVLFFSRVPIGVSDREGIDLDAPLPDFSEYTVVRDRKEAFFEFLRPLIREVNWEIRSDRDELLSYVDALAHKGQLSKRQWRKVFQLARKYRIEEDKLQADRALLEELLLRVHIIPESLVLAQAANESAWGRSRFARRGNNLFGQWCFSEGCGIVPKGRPEGETYEVAEFDSPLDSIRSYMMNLNTFHAYDELRKIRHSMVQQEQPISGKSLAQGLINYSTRREAYVKEIRLMIEQNDLE